MGPAAGLDDALALELGAEQFHAAFHLRLPQHRRPPLGFVGQVHLVAEGVRMRRLRRRRTPRQGAEGLLQPRGVLRRQVAGLQFRRDGDVPCDAAEAAHPDAHGAQSGTFTASQEFRTASTSRLWAP